MDRQLVSDDWSGLKARLELAYAASGCDVSDFTEWMMQLGVVFGFAPQTQTLSRRLMDCDPLDADNDRTAMEACNWAGSRRRRWC